jgi:hypothetical protein
MSGDEAGTGDSHGAEARGWIATVEVEEHAGQTRAKVSLRWRDQEAVGVGLSRLAPSDRFNAQIGDELAVAKAFSDLSRRMMAGVVQHIEAEEQRDSRRRLRTG